jgi:hypothetical protein
MSGKHPLFTTGSNCYIKINDIRIAYATGLEVDVSIPHTSYYTLGRYEPENIQPASYSVKGSFTVLKYIEGLKDKLHKQVPDGSSNYGNSIGAMSPSGGDLVGGGVVADKLFEVGGISAIGGAVVGVTTSMMGNMMDSKVQFSLIPKYLNQSVFFDIEVYQNIPESYLSFGDAILANTIKPAIDLIRKNEEALSDRIKNPIQVTTQVSGVCRIRQCRITSMKQSISKKQITTQTYTFEGTYFDDDTFVALASTN